MRGFKFNELFVQYFKNIKKNILNKISERSNRMCDIWKDLAFMRYT